jgi:hypothetical protein
VITLKELKEKSEAAKSWEVPSDASALGKIGVKLLRMKSFHDAASPEVVLELLDRLERAYEF